MRVHGCLDDVSSLAAEIVERGLPEGMLKCIAQAEKPYRFWEYTRIDAFHGLRPKRFGALADPPLRSEKWGRRVERSAEGDDAGEGLGGV